MPTSRCGQSRSACMGVVASTVTAGEVDLAESSHNTDLGSLPDLRLTDKHQPLSYTVSAQGSTEHLSSHRLKDARACQCRTGSLTQGHTLPFQQDPVWSVDTRPSRKWVSVLALPSNPHPAQCFNASMEYLSLSSNSD